MLGVEKVAITGSESLILRLKEQYFGLLNDIFLTYTYCVPANSCTVNSDYMPGDVFEDLSEKLSLCNSKGDIILLGDINARTQQLSDFIYNEDNQHIPVPPPELYDANTIGTSVMKNIDTGSNSYGNKFLDLCKSVPLRILNGRKLGDILGNYACYNARGQSAVDYGAVSPSLFDSVPVFSVSPPCLPLSDHTPIHLCLKVNAVFPISESSSDNLLPRPDKIVWDRQFSDKYKYMMESPDCKDVLNSSVVTGILPNQESIDSAVGFLTNIMVETSCKVGMQIKKGAIPRRSAQIDQFSCKRRVKHPRWYDQECRQVYSELKRTSMLLSSNPTNSWLRGRMFVENKNINV